MCRVSEEGEVAQQRKEGEVAVGFFPDWRISPEEDDIRQSGKKTTGTSPSSLENFSLRTTTTYPRVYKNQFELVVVVS